MGDVTPDDDRRRRAAGPRRDGASGGAAGLLEYTFGTDLLRWELTPIDTGTRLTLRHTVSDRDWIPKVAAGWHLCLIVAERLLDGRPTGPIGGRDARRYGWDELNDAYAKRLSRSSTG